MSKRRMKTRAPPPPPVTHHIFTNSVHDVGGTLSIDSKENMMRPTVNFKLIPPHGYQTAVTEDGSKPLMDLLVDLCSRYQLNPALHTLELLSPQGHSLGFKPNVLLGSLDVASVLIKEKPWEDLAARRSAPKIPERTVRLMVNYHGSQKAVVRVNPLVPLQALIPVICEKCEFDPTCVELLKDSISRQKLPLDKSLTQLGLKELYVLDRSFVLQPKMGSSPALNYSESFGASTNSLDRGTKKGLLGLFQFGRRKSRSETSSLVMDDPNDKIIQNEDRCSALSAISDVPTQEDQPSTMEVSRSVMNVYKTSPKYEIKKRRAPPPPVPAILSLGPNTLAGCQMDSESESQERKRKAPAPPSSPDSITPDSYGASTATPITVNQSSQNHSPSLYAKMAESMMTISSKASKTTRPKSPIPKIRSQSFFAVAPKSVSPSLTKRIVQSQVLHDSNSELSHSLGSNLDTDDTVSLTTSAVRESVHINHLAKHDSTKMKELGEGSSKQENLRSGPASSPISKTQCESVLNRKMDEIESKRCGTIGTTDLTAPPKPRRSPAWEHRTLSTPTKLSLCEPTKSSVPQKTTEKEETACQTWFHSIESRDVSVQASGTEAPEAETLSLGNSSSGSSLPDQGYAASEGMGDAEDSGLVSSPSDTHPTSPEGNLFLERSCEARREKPPRPIRDLSSDSDEGCATWGSNNSQSKLQPISGKVSSTFQEKYKWLHQAKTDAVFPVIPGIPMSTVDLNIPVTAIDEVLEEYKPLLEKIESTVLTETKLADHKGLESVAEWHKNCSTVVFIEKNSIAIAKPDQYRNTMENGTNCHTKEGKNEDLKEATQRLTLVKPFEPEENCGSLLVKSQTLRSDSLMESNAQCLQEDCLSILKDSERSVSTEKVDNPSLFRSNSSSHMVHRTVTCNSTSRFGMKTFTVVPSKPSVMQSGAQNASASFTAGAIKIDEQGNIMKRCGLHHRVGDATASEITRSEECPLIGKAKAFWSCSERQECAPPCRTGVIDTENLSIESIESTHAAVTTLTTYRQEPLKTQQTSASTVDSAPPKETNGKINETIHRVSIKNKPQTVGNDVSVPESIKQPQQPLPSFLKPTRRTSSQYVASAINKYGPMGSTKPNSLSFPTQNLAFHTLGHSMQGNPRQSSKISLTDRTFNRSDLHHPCHVRSMSDPELVFESQRENKEDKKENTESSDDCPFSLGPVSDRIKHFQPSVPTQIAITEREIRDVRDNQRRSPSISCRNDPLSTAKPQTTTRLTATPKSEPSRTLSDSGVYPGSPPVNIFGPVKKFKPVVCRSIEKDTSLHSNLMEAIQGGGGKDRLKKISSSEARSKKETEDNERAALLAAIRAQNSTGRLRKTKSGAAAELERFRLASQEDQRTDVPSSPSPISFTCTSGFSSQPPSILASLPPSLHQSKSSNVGYKNANALKNPALAREAVMEAIRSGSAAENLKKVAVPTKTVQVNGRLGTMHPTCSSLHSE
ncbi:protein cordon-bleu isoform X2 [Stigmatopora argus]